MANDYGSMQSRIADELDRTTLTSQIQLEILSAIRHYERERFWFTEGRATASTVANQVSQADLIVPTDLILDIQRLDLTYNGLLVPLQRLNWNDFEDIGGADPSISAGLPYAFAYAQNQLWFYPIPDSAYTLTMSYIKQLTALSASTDTNQWMTDGEELVRSRARQAIKINYRNDARAMEMIIDGYYSLQEKMAHQSLLRTSAKRLARGPLMMPMGMPSGRTGRFNIYRGF